MSAQRRVYMLAPDLIQRVTEFQAKSGFASEVEAVRFLLDAGLVEKEDSRALQVRAERVVAEGGDPLRMLFGHPSVKRVSGVSGPIMAGPIDVECKDGHVFMLATKAVA